jgi:long-chain acyl-CoA synthetase
MQSHDAPPPGVAGIRTYATLVDLIADAAQNAPTRCALRAGDVALTYAQYARAIAGFAQHLRQLGAAGRTVTVILRNGPEIAVSLFAIFQSGACANPVNADYTPRELGQILADSQPHLIVTRPELAAGVRAALPPGCSAGWIVLPEDPADGLATWTGASGEPPAPSVIDPDAVALLQYTGGTTGLPKGVELTHRQLATNIAQRERVLPSVDGDRVLCMMPLFHSFAMAMGLFLAAYARGTLVILPRYRPDWVIEAIADHAITVLPAGPTVFRGLLAALGDHGGKLGSLRVCYSGSAALSADTLQRWEARTGCHIYEGYGQTEAGPILTYAGPGHPAPAGSVGFPLSGTTLQIVDTETGRRVLQAGELGEIRARGPQIMRGYRNRPDATAEALRDGWLYTGDIGQFDDQGALFIRDRKKDMVVTGGFNVYPREVEEVLASHPGVCLAAVVGAPDPYRGEILRAAVQLFPHADCTEPELLSWCAAQLVKYKLPRNITFFELPLTQAGKIDKRAVAAKLADAQEPGTDSAKQAADAAI